MSLTSPTRSTAARPSAGAAIDFIAHYLRLDIDLRDLHAIGDSALDEALALCPGLRVLGQDPLETLLTFVCTPANNVTRITRSIDALARLYGPPIATLD